MHTYQALEGHGGGVLASSDNKINQNWDVGVGGWGGRHCHRLIEHKLYKGNPVFDL